MLKYIFTTTLIVSSLISVVSSKATTETLSSSSTTVTPVLTDKSPNRLIGEKELDKLTYKEYDIINCQITQNQSMQQIKEYQNITQKFINDVKSDKVKIYEKESKLQQFFLKNSDKIENITKINLGVTDHLNKIEKYECTKETKFSRKYAIPQAKNLAYLKTILNQAANKSSASSEVSSNFVFVDCKINSDIMTARWNITGNRQINSIKDWEEYLDKVTNKVTKDNSRIIDKNKLELSKIEFKKAKENYQKLFAEAKENYLNRKCLTDSKLNKITNENANDKAKTSNKSWAELKKIFESIRI